MMFRSPSTIKTRTLILLCLQLRHPFLDFRCDFLDVRLREELTASGLSGVCDIFVDFKYQTVVPLDTTRRSQNQLGEGL